jgi:hypothetical protein
MREAPGDPAFELTWLGDEKMPEPMINPMIRERPFKYVNDLCFSNDGPLRSWVGAIGVPSAVYPAAVVERGNRFEEKSKAEETE